MAENNPRAMTSHRTMQNDQTRDDDGALVTLSEARQSIFFSIGNLMHISLYPIKYLVLFKFFAQLLKIYFLLNQNCKSFYLIILSLVCLYIV